MGIKVKYIDDFYSAISSLEHDYKTWYVDINDGDDSNTGGINDPFEKLQTAYDARIADGYTGVGVIKIMTSGTYGNLITTITSLRTQIITDIPRVIMGDLTVTDAGGGLHLNGFQTIGVFTLNQTATNSCVVRFEDCDPSSGVLISGTVNDWTYAQVDGEGKTLIGLAPGFPDVDLTIKAGATFSTGQAGNLSHLSIFDGFVKLQGTSLVFGTINATGGRITCDASAAIDVGTFIHNGTAFVRPEKINVTGTETPTSGEWAKGDGVTLNEFFVSKTGDNLNEGSRSKPFLTITYALTQVPVGKKSNIYIDDGTYTESFTVDENINFIGLKGNVNTFNVYIDGTITIEINCSFRYLKLNIINQTFDASPVIYFSCDFWGVIPSIHGIISNCTFREDVTQHPTGNSTVFDTEFKKDVTIPTIANFRGCKIGQDLTLNGISTIDLFTVSVVGNLIQAGGTINLYNSRIHGTIGGAAPNVVYKDVDTLNKLITTDQTVESNVLFKKQAGVLGKTVTFATALVFDCDDGNMQRVLITSNITSLTVINAKPSHTYRFYLIQDSGGGNTIPTPNPATFGEATDNSATFITTGNGRNILDLTVDPVDFREFSIETHTI